MDNTAHAQLQALRDKIDGYNRAIVDALSARSACVRQVGELKAAQPSDTTPYYTPERETYILNSLHKYNREIGGARASIYNAVPIESVERLVAFMQAFESTK